MKPVPMVLLILAAAAATWLLFAGGPAPSAPVDGDVLPGDAEPVTPAPAPAPEPPPVPAPVPARDVSAEASARVDLPATTPPKARPRLPLADKFIDRATWSDESAVIVLEHLAQAAGKRLQLSRAMRQRLGKIRVTMDRGRTPVPQALDLVLQPHTMSWYPTKDAIVVHDNDD